MPYSFTQIEKEKTKVIGVVFTFLIGFYFLTLWIIALLVKNYAFFAQGSENYQHIQNVSFVCLGVKDSLALFLFAGVVGFCHWQYTVHNLINKMLGVLKAEPLKTTDSYHKKFQNIIDEVVVATGGQNKIEGVVVPTVALNAFALEDFSGRAVIGVTEGLLARLNRAQLEGVVAHEAAHIVSGDCVATTVTCSLFELYNGLLKGFELMLRGGGHSRRSYRGSSRGGGGGAFVFILLIYLLLACSRTLSQLARMFVSRQREFRADAIATRLTRDPLSLAEALYGISYHWRGAGLPAQELDAVFIVNPKISRLDESSGTIANLFSTHPPMASRLSVLMNMAHADGETIRHNVKKQDNKARMNVPRAKSTKNEWMVKKGENWTGPFNVTQMGGFDFLQPQMWIKRVGGDVTMMQDDRDLCQHLSTKSTNGKASSGGCPKCKGTLVELDYEGVTVKKCSICQGVLVRENDVKRIMLRTDFGFSENIKRTVRVMQGDEDFLKGNIINRDPKTLLSCPECKDDRKKMNRMFYTEVYRVEVDKCIWCSSVWFDKDELEILQCAVEAANKPSK